MKPSFGQVLTLIVLFFFTGAVIRMAFNYEPTLAFIVFIAALYGWVKLIQTTFFTKTKNDKDEED